MKIILEVVDGIPKQKEFSYDKSNDRVVLKIPSILLIILSMIILSFLIIGVVNNINKFIPFLI